MRHGFWSAHVEEKVVGGRLVCGGLSDLLEVLDRKLLDNQGWTLVEFLLLRQEGASVYGYKTPSLPWQTMAIGQFKDGGFITEQLGDINGNGRASKDTIAKAISG